MDVFSLWDLNEELLHLLVFDICLDVLEVKDGLNSCYETVHKIGTWPQMHFLDLQCLIYTHFG